MLNGIYKPCRQSLSKCIRLSVRIERSRLSCCVLYQHVLRSIVSEVKMSCSCSPKAKASQSRVCKQNNCPRFGNQSTLSRILTKQASFVLIYAVSTKHGPYKRWTADCGLRTADCGLRTADCGLRTGYNTRT